MGVSVSLGLVLGTGCGEGGFNLEVGILELGGRLRVLRGEPLDVAAVPVCLLAGVFQRNDTSHQFWEV